MAVAAIPAMATPPIGATGDGSSQAVRRSMARRTTHGGKLTSTSVRKHSSALPSRMPPFQAKRMDWQRFGVRTKRGGMAALAPHVAQAHGHRLAVASACIIPIFDPGRAAISRLVKPSPISTMTEDRHLNHRLRALRSAERELDEARLRSDLNRAARRLMHFKARVQEARVDGGRICLAIPEGGRGHAELQRLRVRSEVGDCLDRPSPPTWVVAIGEVLCRPRGHGRQVKSARFVLALGDTTAGGSTLGSLVGVLAAYKDGGSAVSSGGRTFRNRASSSRS